MTSGATAFVYVTVRVLAALGAGAAVGWFAGSAWMGVTGALALYLAWNLWQLRALGFWLQHRSVADPPNASGLWGDVVAQVVRLHRRKRFHKERLTRLFRELRRSTAAMPDGVVMLDPQGEIVWFNRKAGELLDLTRRADLGLRIDNLVRNPDFVRYLHGGQHSLAGHRAHRHADRALHRVPAHLLRRVAAAADAARRHARSAARADAQGLRRERVARAALAADRRRRAISRRSAPIPSSASSRRRSRRCAARPTA